MDNNISSLMSNLNPKTRKRLKMASEIELKRVPLASSSITNALGGGLAMGRQYLLYGSKSAGKSALMMQSIGIWQKMGYSCAWVDVEGCFDPEWAERLGIDTEQLIISDAKVSDEIVEDIVDLMNSEIDFVIVDSITAMIPMGWIEKNGEIKDLGGTNQIGSQAVDLAKALKLINAANKNTCIILISQLRNNITTYGAVPQPTGGQAVQFYSTACIKVYANKSDKEQIKQQVDINGRLVEKSVGREVTFVVEYNKIGPPNKTGAYDFYYDGETIGVDTLGELISLAITLNIINQSGAWFVYKDQKFHGKTNTIEFFKQNPENIKILEGEINGLE